VGTEQRLHIGQGRAGERGEGVFVGRIFKHAREGCEIQRRHPGWRRAECRLAAAGARQQPQRLRYLRGRCGFVQHRWHWRGVSWQRLKLWSGSVMLFGRIAHGGRPRSFGTVLQACAAECGFEADDLQLSFPSAPAPADFHTSTEWAIEINLQI